MRIGARVVGRVDISPDENVVIDHQKLDRADFSRRKLLQFCAIGSRFNNCHFEDSQITDASFGSGMEMSEYVDCCFDRVRFEHGGGYARFVRCSFREVNLHSWMCFGTEMIGCVFSGKLKRCIFNGTILEDTQTILGRVHNDFYDNDFSEAKLIDVAFRTGIDLTRQKLPTNDKHICLLNVHLSLPRAKEAIEAMPPTEERREALSLVEALDFEASGGQHQLFLSIADHNMYSPDVVRGVFALLQEPH